MLKTSQRNILDISIVKRQTEYQYDLLLTESVGYEGLMLFSPVRNTRKF